MDYYCCIDIGGTMIKHGVVNQEGQIISQDTQPTHAHLGGLNILDKVISIIKKYSEGYDLVGVGISTAGIVDHISGTILHSGPQIPNYTGIAFKNEIENQLKLPCEVENDVNCAGLAEVISGSAKDSLITLTLTIGTGIGGCLLFGNKIFHGFSNSACEIGYMDMCGQEFQQRGSATTMVKKVSLWHQDDESTWNGQRIFEEAQVGNELCIKGIEEMIDSVTTGIATICYVINPETVVLGGGIMSQKNYLESKFQQSLSKKLIPQIAKKTNLVFAHHKNNAGILGAFYIISNKLKKQ